jgi:archaellum component FlaC
MDKKWNDQKESMDKCQESNALKIYNELTKKIESIEEKAITRDKRFVNNSSIKDNNGEEKNRRINDERSRISDIENNIKGLNIKLDKMSWFKEQISEQYTNMGAIEKRIADIDGWRVATVCSINSEIIPFIARLQCSVDGLTRRVDGINRYIGHNRLACDKDGTQLTLMTSLLKRSPTDERMEAESPHQKQQHEIHPHLVHTQPFLSTR